MKRSREIEPTDVDAIHVGERLRAVSPDRVASLAASMKDIGLMTPISVRYFENYRINGEDVLGVPVLIAGATRLAAAKSLGWDMIDCVYLDMDDIDAKLWEIAENLHRAELTVLEKSEHVAEWVKLTEQKASEAAALGRENVRNSGRAAGLSGQLGQKTPGRPTGGILAAARELNIPGKTDEAKRHNARRGIQIDSITPQAKEAARAAKLDDNQSALLKVAAAPKEKQLEEVERLSHLKARHIVPAFTASQRRIQAAQDAFLKLAEDERRVFIEWLDEAA